MNDLSKKWSEISRRYRTYMKLEKHLSENTIESYMRDLAQFAHFILRMYDVPPTKVEQYMIERYMGFLFDRQRTKSSQARELSSIKGFYTYLLLTDRIETLPTEFVSAPKAGRHLPDTLSVEEIERIVLAK